MKGRIIVIYKSSTGFTEKYARWIGEELNCDVVDYKGVTAAQLNDYDTVVFGSRAHAGRIDGYKKMREIVQKSHAGRLLLFVTGAMPKDAKEALEAFWRQNLTEGEMQEILHFYMPGGLCYEKMPFLDRMMMKAFVAMVKKKKDKTSEDEKMAHMVAGSYDLSDRAYIEPLVAALR